MVMERLFGMILFQITFSKKTDFDGSVNGSAS